MFTARRIVVVAAVAIATTAACKKDEGNAADRPEPQADKPSKACSGAHETTGALHWFEDDFEGAIACATERKLPLVLDMWAPWCHTCLSMQSTVFTDPAFAPFADRFVFVALDTDREVNALPVAAYPPAAWPTFWVIAPHGEIQGRFVGAASVDQFRDFLTEGEQAFVDGEQLPADQPLALVRAGDRAMAASKQRSSADPEQKVELAAAEAAYDAALAKAPADWSRRPDVLVSALSVKAALGPPDRCVEFAAAHLGETGRAASVTDFLVTALGCAKAHEQVAPEPTKALRIAAATRLEGVIADATAPLSADDRADAMMNLREVYDALGRPADAKAMAEKERVLLDEAAAKAPTPLAAMTHNWPRAEVYAYLARQAELVPALEKSAADLPDEYDPPYRLAWLYKSAQQFELALTWARKAVALAYGPRKTRVQTLIVDVLKALGETTEEIAARRELITFYEALPPEQARPAELEKAKVELAALEAAAKIP